MTTHGIAQYIRNHPTFQLVEIDGQEIPRILAIEALERVNKLWPDVELMRSPDSTILTIITNEN